MHILSIFSCHCSSYGELTHTHTHTRLALCIWHRTSSLQSHTVLSCCVPWEETHVCMWKTLYLVLYCKYCPVKEKGPEMIKLVSADAEPVPLLLILPWPTSHYNIHTLPLAQLWNISRRDILYHRNYHKRNKLWQRGLRHIAFGSIMWQSFEYPATWKFPKLNSQHS